MSSRARHSSQAAVPAADLLDEDEDEKEFDDTPAEQEAADSICSALLSPFFRALARPFGFALLDARPERC